MARKPSTFRWLKDSLINRTVEVVYGKRRNTFSYDVDDVFDKSLNAYTENLFFL